MSVFTLRTKKYPLKASEFFLKLYDELDTSKYKSDKYHELLKLASFQHMHDSDLAYRKVYYSCYKNARSKTELLACLKLEEKLQTSHPQAFNDDDYKNYLLHIIKEIKQKLDDGALDYIFI
ncbi:MAG: hypothetical protein ABI203_09300 [Mucilaginibacter sp.]